MKKYINIETQFRWKILKPKTAEDNWIGVCDRLKTITEADSLYELIENMQSDTTLLFEDLYATKEFNKFTFDHSIVFKSVEFIDTIDVTPNVFMVED